MGKSLRWDEEMRGGTGEGKAARERRRAPGALRELVKPAVHQSLKIPPGQANFEACDASLRSVVSSEAGATVGNETDYTGSAVCTMGCCGCLS